MLLPAFGGARTCRLRDFLPHGFRPPPAGLGQGEAGRMDLRGHCGNGGSAARAPRQLGSATYLAFCRCVPGSGSGFRPELSGPSSVGFSGALCVGIQRQVASRVSWIADRSVGDVLLLAVALNSLGVLAAFLHTLPRRRSCSSRAWRWRFMLSGCLNCRCALPRSKACIAASRALCGLLMGGRWWRPDWASGLPR